MPKSLKKNYKVSILSLVILAGLAFWFLVTPTPDAKSFIEKQMKACFADGGRNKCYQKAAGLFLRHFSIPQILATLTQTEGVREVFARCHEVTHYVGRQAYRDTRSVAFAYDMGREVCHGGFYHGVLEQYFKEKNFNFIEASNQELAEEIRSVCGQEQAYPKPRTYWECVHGLGHAMMFITEANLPRSLELCGALQDVARQEGCYGGAFMENSSSSTNFDHPTAYLNPNDPNYPCPILAKPYQKVCYKYQSSYFAEVSKWDWAKTIALCFGVPGEYQVGCFQILGSNQVGYSQDLKAAKQTCDLISISEAKQNCLRGVVDGLAGRYVGQENWLLQFCGMVEAEYQSFCYEIMGQGISGWTRDAAALEKICGQIPQEQYRSLCLKPAWRYN